MSRGYGVCFNVSLALNLVGPVRLQLKSVYAHLALQAPQFGRGELAPEALACANRVATMLA